MTGKKVSRLTVAVLLTGALALLLGGLQAPAALARSSSSLYYETQTRTGQLAIDKLDLSGPPTSTQVVAVGDVSLFGIAVAGPYVYWSYESGLHDRGAIMRATLDGQGVRRLVGGLASPESLIAVHGYLYVNANGSGLRRRFLTDSLYPMALAAGGTAEALAG